MRPASDAVSRRRFLSAGAVSLSVPALAARISAGDAAEPSADRVVAPPAGKRLLLSCKLGMIAKEAGGKRLTLAERLSLAAEAGFDGVDLDEAGGTTPEEARAAVRRSGVFVHNAIDHAHWEQRLTSAKDEERARGRANIEHCLRVSHAAGGSAVLVVLGHGNDGPAEVIEERARAEVRKLVPLAAALGQMILIENVGNRMGYVPDAPPEQGPGWFIRFIDAIGSPWVGMYYDLGNHYRIGQPAEWIRALGHRCVKMDVKGFSRALGKFTEITEGDLPWDQVRKAIDEIGFAGWVTAEVSGGDVGRLTAVRRQMGQAFGL